MIHSVIKQDADGRMWAGAGRQRGFSMLLTIMVLVLLITVVVTFQSDMFLRMRASQYRQTKVQCRYAAESGLVMAFKMVDQALEAQRKGDFKAISSILKKKKGDPKDPNQPGEKATADPNSPAGKDPNSLKADDPNQVQTKEEDPIARAIDLTDPNQLAALLEGGDLLEAVPLENPLIINKKVIEVGEATVEIEVYDENAKLPLHWNTDSPYLSGAVRDKDLVNNLGSILGVENDTINAARDLIGTFGRSLQARGIRKVIEQRKGASLNFRGPAGLTAEQQNQPLVWEQQRLRLSYSKAREMEYQQRELMASLTARINYEIAENEPLAAILSVPLAGDDGTFLDYVGTWGHDRINLNTAPAEVLTAAFKIMGFDESMAQAIVNRREEKPFTSTYELKTTSGIDERVVDGLVTLTTVRSDTFSIQIRAQQGQCETRLVAGIYRDRLGQLKTIAVFKPKGY